jgi:serine/threonine protein kinase
LKLANIFLTDKCMIKIGDFGLIKKSEKSLDMDKTGTYCGTPGYMAPEITHEGSDYSLDKIDVFACGVILFILCTGRQPFNHRGDSYHRMMQIDSVGYLQK